MIRTLHGRAAITLPPKGRRGSALVTALIALMFVMVMGAGVLALSMTGMRITNRTRINTIAFNCAESGAELAARWLKEQGSPPPGTAPFDPFGGAQTLGSGTYQVTITPDPANPGASLKKYAIVCNGYFNGRSERVETIARQQSFGRYAYFTDRETSSITGGAVWFFAGDRIRGPAHSNNAGGSNFKVSWGGTSAIFEGMLTSAASAINYAPTNPNTEAQFAQIYETGSQGYQVGVDPIPLPSSTDVQKVAAWGAGSGFPSGTSVSVPANGGIYISGDSTVVMSVDGSGNQQFAITQGGNTTTVVVEPNNNRRRYKVNSGSWTNVPGAGSGVLYTDGNISSLSGTVADNWLTGGNPPQIQYRSATTIATDVNNNKSVTITDNLRYNSAPNPDLPTDNIVNLRPGTLGLMARNVAIGSGAPTNLEVDAVMMAGSSSVSDGSFFVTNYNTKTPTGTLKVMGGIIQKARGPVGTLSGGVLATGYAKDYYYDPRLADAPPPFFPTTGSYDRTSWRRLSGSG